MKRVNEAILTAYLDDELTQAERKWVESQVAMSANLQATLIQLRREKSQVDQGLATLVLPILPVRQQSFSQNGSASSNLMVWESPGLWSDTVNGVRKVLGGRKFYWQTAVIIGLIFIGVGVFSAWIGLFLEAERAAPATSAKPILFTTRPDEASGAKAQIYTISPDDLTPTSLPALNFDNGLPSLSLAGRQVIISAIAGGDVVVTNETGGESINLTNSADNLEKYPVLSPDGQYVAFTDGRSISLIDLKNDRQDTIVTGIAGANLVWSPDGQRLAFISAKGSQTDLYIVNIDGTNLINLTNDTIVEMHPTWSPDGRQIAFADGDSITVIDVAGTNRVKLPYNNPGYHFPRHPLWSPDGTRLAFVASRMEPNLDAQIQTLFTIQVDGGHLTMLTDDQTWVGAFFDWSPDGRQLAFARGDYGQEQLYVMNADGTGQTPLADDKIKGVDYIEWGTR